MNLLFTGIGRRIELLQAFREASAGLKKPIKLYGADIDATAPALAFCDEAVIAPHMVNAEYIPFLLRLCKKEKIVCIIPTIDTDLLALSENKEQFHKIATTVLVSDPTVIQLCRDKIKTVEIFKNCGFVFPHSVIDWREYTGTYPAFIKPRFGSASKNAFQAENEEALAFYAKRIPDYIVQPYISGREYSIDIFCDWKGNAVSIVPRERLQIRSGEVLKTKICMDTKMIDQCRIICAQIKVCGPLTVQLIRDISGTDWFIEINPRYGGGAPLSMRAGARSAEALLRLLDGEDAGEYEIEDGAVYSRFDQAVRITAIC